MPAALLITACGGGDGDGREAGTDEIDTAAVIADARACTGGEAGPFAFEAGQLTALGEPAAFNAALSAAFIDAARQRACVFTLASGLSLRIDRAVTDDTAASPDSGDLVTVHYEGKLISGEVFDSSYARDEPATFPSDRLIAGWVEALPLMRVGEAWTLYIPSDLAYGERGTPGGPIGPNQALTFRLELLALPDAE
ncbi:FKBP-type peptidyl-prolyl cis-trans isomerase [Marinicauda algicola]|uniref:Peptidyl-prolyl cis-trans isomerase n=1 Tax=Marinicauda algicola TaxID=2029849 RepID=A0A4S2H1G1_9PROT|nr:FKBP-type peptidyl-prolyl cis-trans isomerase [Marinicauda algicola]